MVERSVPRVAIVGAGFGGLWTAKALAGKPVEVTLIDKNNYHTFFPLLYQVAAAEVDPGDIVHPVRKILREIKNVRFALAEIQAVDFETRVLDAGDLKIPYDYLVLATGSTVSYFGVPGAEQYTFPLRTMEQAINLRNHILCRFETASFEQDPEVRRRMLTFVIVGGGPTGVEFAGALEELIRGPLVKDFPNLDFSEVSVVLIEGLDRLLTYLPENLSEFTLKRLQKMGVDVRLQTMVNEVFPDGVRLQNGEVISTDTVVWSAGAKGAAVDGWGLPTNRVGQIEVTETLQVNGLPGVYVVGDLASCKIDGEALPMLAPVATQQAETAAENILRQVRGEAPEQFRYTDLGAMTVIGRNAAVANLFGRWTFTGFVAWVMWLGVHLFRLIGFRNRLMVLTNWAWDYLFFERVVRLILP
ncbi:MAG: NAD(P)/FAD-dependent oxidoreductase [Anaerolineales bacterium]|nr:NAD(P)/FAD-dependent oxidoreductase [Anaerolineales bacterium]